MKDATEAYRLQKRLKWAISIILVWFTVLRWWTPGLITPEFEKLASPFVILIVLIIVDPK